MTAAVNVEAIKLQLIKNQEFLNRQQDKEFVFSQEAIRNIVKALEFSDYALSNEIETFLVHSGKEALPEVVKGLRSDNINVKSTCAMVLIRAGAPSIAVVNEFYNACKRPEQIHWVVEFILGELGSEVPAPAERPWNETVIPLERAV